MSRYRSYGKLDDPFVSEGDTFFLRMNSRLRANQLKAGEVAISENGRMSDDGTWQPRKGLATVFGSITAGDSLRLPFTVQSAQRLNNQMILVLNETPNLAFFASADIHVDNLGYTGSDNPNGNFILEDVNFFTKTITYNNPGANSTDFTIVDDTQGGTTIVAPGSSNPTELDFIVTDEGINEVYGSAVFTDAASQADDFIFTATNSQCFIVRLKDQALFKVRYNAGSETINRPCSMLQANNKMYIFRGQETTLECDPNITYLTLTSVSQSGQVITVNANNHGRNVGDFITIKNLGGWTSYDPDGVYEVKTSSTNSFTVEMLDSQTVASFNISGTEIAHFDDFQEVASGAYTAPAYYTDTTTTATDGVVTMDVGNHVIEPGDTLVIQNGASPYDLFIGKEVVVTSVSDTNSDNLNDRLTFNLGVQNEPSGASLTVSKPLAIGKGFIHQPGANFGVVNGGRMWLPYFYTSDNTPSDRPSRTEIVASDVLDFDTYDVIGNQFNITAGQSDFIVGLEPFRDQLIVFMRKSIHVINGISGSLADCTTSLLTTEVGCSARKTIVQVANKIYFLSDRGLYAIEYFDEINLRGIGVPITETIQPYMDRINQNYAHLSTAVYHDNRIWLALPLDSVPGANNGFKVNTIIVWNLLNDGVESIDTVDSLDFAIRDFIVGREGAQNELYLTTEEGGIHKVDANNGGDVVSLVSGEQDETIAVNSRLVTRQYDANSLDRKHFSQAEFQIKGEDIDPSDAEIQFITEDPDSTSVAGSISTFLGDTLPAQEDSSIRTRVRQRGFGIQAQVRPSTGRPFVRAVKVDARLHDRSTTSIS